MGSFWDLSGIPPGLRPDASQAVSGIPRDLFGIRCPLPPTPRCAPGAPGPRYLPLVVDVVEILADPRPRALALPVPGPARQRPGTELQPQRRREPHRDSDRDSDRDSNRDTGARPEPEVAPLRAEAESEVAPEALRGDAAPGGSDPGSAGGPGPADPAGPL